ncbi:MAG: hypothetical protein WC804_10225 [Sphingomonas sp.]|uniref:hypothetical protein n=1 Tax=Sphingomonas sp. TaxID=28214 RepID=UPI0035698BC9
MLIDKNACQVTPHGFKNVSQRRSGCVAQCHIVNNLQFAHRCGNGLAFSGVSGFSVEHLGMVASLNFDRARRIGDQIQAARAYKSNLAMIRAAGAIGKSATSARIFRSSGERGEAPRQRSNTTTATMPQIIADKAPAIRISLPGGSVSSRCRSGAARFNDRLFMIGSSKERRLLSLYRNSLCK